MSIILLPLSAWGEDWQLLTYYQDGGYTSFDQEGLYYTNGKLYYSIKKEFHDHRDQVTPQHQQANQLAGEPVDYVIAHYVLPCQGSQVATLRSYSFYRTNQSRIGGFHKKKLEPPVVPFEPADYYLGPKFCPSEQDGAVK